MEKQRREYVGQALHSKVSIRSVKKLNSDKISQLVQ